MKRKNSQLNMDLILKEFYVKNLEDLAKLKFMVY